MKIDTLLSKEQLLKELHDIGDQKYHHRHPFHLRMHNGSLKEQEMRCWIKNRFYYQSILPGKDAIVLSKLPHAKDRRQWVKRIIDQDGDDEFNGGIEAWITLGRGAGIGRAEMLDLGSVGTQVRKAVDSYVEFCRERSWLEAVASSLTELFAPRLIANRMDVFRKHYSWIDPDALQYFFNRLKQAPETASMHCN